MGLLLSLTGPALSQDTYQLPDGATVSTLDTFRECDVCPEMIVLPKERFTMGADLEESAYLHSLIILPKPGQIMGFANEGPKHEVLADYTIAVGRNEVTFSEWMACVEDGGCTHTPSRALYQLSGTTTLDDPRYPVRYVSYADMQVYLAWLNEKVGIEAYRLPTEAEWEYAARGGAKTRFGQGDTLTEDIANIGFFRLEGRRSIMEPRSRNYPVVVDTLDAANSWGLRHMAGNLGEMTMSCITKRHLGLSTLSSYLAKAKQASECRRVTKGGRYAADADFARPAMRNSTSENHRSQDFGFRIIREIKGEW